MRRYVPAVLVHLVADYGPGDLAAAAAELVGFPAPGAPVEVVG